MHYALTWAIYNVPDFRNELQEIYLEKLSVLPIWLYPDFQHAIYVILASFLSHHYI